MRTIQCPKVVVCAGQSSVCVGDRVRRVEIRTKQISALPERLDLRRRQQHIQAQDNRSDERAQAYKRQHTQMASGQSTRSKEGHDHRRRRQQRPGVSTQIANSDVLLIQHRPRNVIRGPGDLSSMADPLVGHDSTDPHWTARFNREQQQWHIPEK